MLKKEIAKLLESLKDDDDIDETVSKSDLGKALASNGLTLEAFKKKANDADFKAYLDSIKDNHAKEYLNTWKTKNLQKLVDDEYYKKHPEEKKDANTIKIEELTKKLEENERATKLEKVKSSTLKALTDKKLPSELLNLIVSDDEVKTNNALTTLEGIFKTHDESLKADFIKGNMYTPGGDPNGGDKSTGGYAQQIADSMAKENTNLEQARESYFK